MACWEYTYQGGRSRTHHHAPQPQASTSTPAPSHPHPRLENTGTRVCISPSPRAQGTQASQGPSGYQLAHTRTPWTTETVLLGLPPR